MVHVCDKLANIRKLALSPMESNFSMESLSKAGVLTIVMDYLKFTESVKIQQEAAWIANAISYIGIIEDIEFLACYIPDLIKLLNSSSILLELVRKFIIIVNINSRKYCEYKSGLQR